MSPRMKELFFLVLRWLGIVGTFVCIASAAGTLAMGSLYGTAAHLALATWSALSLAFLSLWIVAGRKLRSTMK